jgi:ribose 5-phosphate isomerase A
MVDESKIVRTSARSHAPHRRPGLRPRQPSAPSCANLGLNGVCRRTINGELFITDNGNLVLDVALGRALTSPSWPRHLNDIPGVIDHGLFLTEADEILVERDSGTIERRVRER